MNTVKFNKKNTLVIAHRGLSGLEVENTNAAFIAAGNRSYYGVETDIRVTADGKYVLNHDGDLNRIAGENIVIEENKLEEIQAVILLDKDGTKNRLDLRVCTLDNYVSICKKYNKHCVLELKSDFSDSEIEDIIKIINDLNYLNEVTFISFNYENLLKIKKILPLQSAQFLFDKFSDDLIAKLVADGIDVDVYYKALSKEKIKELHSLGLKINCWTVDNAQDAEKLAKWGVDYITSNILE